jgi:hypothetical protein
MVYVSLILCDGRGLLYIIVYLHFLKCSTIFVLSLLTAGK